MQQALDLDPDYPRANSLLAWSLAARVQLGCADVAATLATARLRAQRAIRRDPDDPWTHFAAGYVHMVARRTEEAVAELSEAIELNPSLAFAHTILGSAYGYAGMAADGLHHCSLATKLSPRAYFHPATLAVGGLCHLMAGRFDEAVEFERRAVDLRPNFGVAWRTLAAAAGLAGDLDLAKSALSRGTAFPPDAVRPMGRRISWHRPRAGPREIHRGPSRGRARVSRFARSVKLWSNPLPAFP